MILIHKHDIIVLNHLVDDRFLLCLHHCWLSLERQLLVCGVTYLNRCVYRLPLAEGLDPAYATHRLSQTRARHLWRLHPRWLLRLPCHKASLHHVRISLRWALLSDGFILNLQVRIGKLLDSWVCFVSLMAVLITSIMVFVHLRSLLLLVLYIVHQNW